MKFSCTTADLLSALQLVSRAISGQQALPILQSVLIEAEGRRCTITATDLELSIITSIPANIENEGALTVPAKALLNFAQYNSDPEVLLETADGTQLKCTSRRGKTMIAGEAATEYPKIATIEKRSGLTLEAPPLLEALNLVTFTCAKTTLRPVLAGVLVHSKDDALIFVATDSYRLSEYRVPMAGVSDISCIIPMKVLEEVKMVLSATRRSGKSDVDDGAEKKEKKVLTVDIALSAQQVEVQIGHTRLLSRLIEGKFPPYQQIIPASSPTKATLSVGEALTAMKRMHYFAKEVNNTLTFKLGAGDVAVHTPVTQLGRDEALLSAEVTGAEAKIALSSTYLLDFLAHLPGQNLSMEISDSMHPAVFRIPGNDHFLHLIMPLRMQEE